MTALVRHRGGVLQLLLDAGKRAPIVRGVVSKELAKVEAKLRAETVLPRPPGCPARTELPPCGLDAATVLAQLGASQSGDCVTPASIGTGGVAPPNRVSGALYLPPASRGGAEHAALLNAASAAFLQTNPMHASVFGSAVALERDVVAMTASLLHASVGSAPDAVRGAVTSGGTESILTAVLAAREYAARTRGLVAGGEIVLAPSAHSAFNKAAHYFGLRLRCVPPRADGRLHGADAARAITRKTVLVVASAVSFPHGLLDDVQGIAAAAAARGVPCHVDACLGGGILPFVEDAGRPPLPPWDFRVPGVTSMSVDNHKYFLAPKGSSCVLFRGKDLRKSAFVAVTDWPGGLYISPGLAGSRSGSLIAAAWASLVYQGRAGLASHAVAILKEAAEFEQGVCTTLPHLQVVGTPASSVVAFEASPAGKAAGLDFYVVNDILTAGGWHLNALQKPASLHFAFTAQQAPGGAAALLADLTAAVHKAVAAGKAGGVVGGSAPIYGMAATTPDRGLVREVLETFQDVVMTG